VCADVATEGEDCGEVHLDYLPRGDLSVLSLQIGLCGHTSFQSLFGNSALGCRRWIPAQFTRILILCPSFRMVGVRAATSAWDERSAV
jgi:hypothetical protein